MKTIIDNEEVIFINEYKILRNEDSLKLETIREGMDFTVTLDNFYYDLAYKLNYFYHMDTMTTEVCYCIAVDKEMYPMGIIQVGLGNENSVQGSKRCIINFLTMIGASRYVLVHNHPVLEEIEADKFSEADKQECAFLVSLNEPFNITLTVYMIIYKDGINCLDVHDEIKDIQEELVLLRAEVNQMKKQVKKKGWFR